MAESHGPDCDCTACHGVRTMAQRSAPIQSLTETEAQEAAGWLARELRAGNLPQDEFAMEDESDRSTAKSRTEKDGKAG